MQPILDRSSAAIRQCIEAESRWLWVTASIEGNQTGFDLRAAAVSALGSEPLKPAEWAQNYRQKSAPQTRCSPLENQMADNRRTHPIATAAAMLPCLGDPARWQRRCIAPR